MEENKNYPNNFIPASMTLGIIGIVTSCCIYVSLVCGALSIIFALLSKGGEEKMSLPAKRGMMLGIIAVVATVVITVASLVGAIAQYGGFDQMMDAYTQIYEQYLDMLQ